VFWKVCDVGVVNVSTTVEVVGSKPESRDGRLDTSGSVGTGLAARVEPNGGRLSAATDGLVAAIGAARAGTACPTVPPNVITVVVSEIVVMKRDGRTRTPQAGPNMHHVLKRR
jgi:hypothetical protein